MYAHKNKLIHTICDVMHMHRVNWKIRAPPSCDTLAWMSSVERHRFLKLCPHSSSKVNSYVHTHERNMEFIFFICVIIFPQDCACKARDGQTLNVYPYEKRACQMRQLMCIHVMRVSTNSRRNKNDKNGIHLVIFTDKSAICTFFFPNDCACKAR